MRPTVIGIVAVLFSALTMSCRTTNTSQTNDAGTVTTTNQSIEDTLVRWRDSWQTLGLSQEEWVTTYSACHKNPAAANLNKIQHVAYCYLPIEFRLCNSIFLATQDEIDPSDLALKAKKFKECVVSSDMFALLGSADDEKAYAELFLHEGKNLDPAFVTHLETTYMPYLSNDEFTVLVPKIVQRYVTQQGGLDPAEKQLAKTIAPSVENPQMIASIAKTILEVINLATTLRNDYLFLF